MTPKAHGLIGRLGAGLLAAVFLSMAVGAALAGSAWALPAGMLHALKGLTLASALASGLLAVCLAAPMRRRWRNLLACLAGLSALCGQWPDGLLPAALPALGAPAPMVSLGMCVAAACLWSRRPPRQMSMRGALLGSVLLILLILIGLVGAASTLAGPERSSASWLPWLSVSPAPACAFLLLAVWCARRRALEWLPALRNDDRIALPTFVVLTLLVTITGFATFWAVQTRLQESEQERLVQSAYRREMAFNYQLDSAERLATDLARRPGIARALQAWASQPQAAAAALGEEMDAVWNERMTAIRFELPAGDPLPSRGVLLESRMPPLQLESAQDERFELQWNAGLLARVKAPVMQGETVVGWVESQQRLQLMTEQLFETADLGLGVEVRLCYPVSAAEAVCMPGGPDQGSHHVALRRADGQATAIALAMRGDQGSMVTNDLKDTDVIDVYASVRRPLGLRLRQSIDAVMAPVREKLKQVMGVVVVLLGAGMALLMVQVRPLASRLVASEQEARDAQARARDNEDRLRTVMDNVADGIITTDIRGQVTYVNQAAASMTGWQPEEALGRPVSDIYVTLDSATGVRRPDRVAEALQAASESGDTVEIDLLHRDGATRLAVADRASLVRHTDGSPAGVVLVFHDDTALRERTEAIRQEALHDPLTGLANRKKLERRLAQLAGEPETAPPRLHSLLFIDLDKFKQVNDSAGHEAGDHLLREVSALMQKRLRSSDLLARMGGDEFAAVLVSCGPPFAAQVAESLRAAIEALDFEWEGRVFKVGMSVGIANFEGGFGDLAEVLRSADAACYRAKHAGRGNVKEHPGVLRRADLASAQAR